MFRFPVKRQGSGAGRDAISKRAAFDERKEERNRCAVSIDLASIEHLLRRDL